MTTAEAATLLGLTARSVAREIKRGRLAATKRGRDYDIGADAIEQYQQQRRPVGRPRGGTNMKAIEITLNTGTFYIPLATWNDGRSVLISMENGQRVLSAGDVRANWNAWISGLIDHDQMLTRSELDAQHPGIAIDHE